MSIITNLGIFETIKELSKVEYDKITSIEITNIKLINGKFADLILFCVNLKDVNIVKLGMYFYLSKFLLFDIDQCIQMHNYLTNPKNIFLDEYDKKKADFMFWTRNLNIDWTRDIIIQLNKLNNKIINIQRFYENISRLNIEYLSVDYVSDYIYNFTSLKELFIRDYNQFHTFNSCESIKCVLQNNSNLEEFVIDPYERDLIIEEYLCFVGNRISFVNSFVEHYTHSQMSRKKPSCQNCINYFENNEVYFRKSMKNYMSDDININTITHLEIEDFDLNLLLTNSDIKLLSFNLNMQDEKFKYKYYEETMQIIIDSFCNDNLYINNLPPEIKYLHIYSNSIIKFDNLPTTLEKLYIDICQGHNLNKIKLPFGLEIIDQRVGRNCVKFQLSQEQIQ
jgi:hypothetical protein